jgi:hypothetical protein
MAPAAGFEPAEKSLNYPRKSFFASDIPPNIPPSSDLDPDLTELISLWDSLPDTVKRLLLVMAREGGERK